MNEQMKTKTFRISSEKRADGFVKVSDDRVDRDREVILPSAFDVSDYKKNPVMLWNHSSWSMEPDDIVARASEVKVEKDGLYLKPEFNVHTEKGRLVQKMYEDGFLSAFSIGFIPRKTTSSPEEWMSPELKSKLKSGEVSSVIHKADLLEVSIVGIPANPNAVLERSAKSGIDPIAIHPALTKEVMDNFKQAFQNYAKSLDQYCLDYAKKYEQHFQNYAKDMCSTIQKQVDEYLAAEKSRESKNEKSDGLSDDAVKWAFCNKEGEKE